MQPLLMMAPNAGLRAVKPHLDHRGVGAKFEQIQVVMPQRADWLDGGLPHQKLWRS